MKNSALLDLIAVDQGYENGDQMITDEDARAIFLDSCQPGVCKNCHAVTEPHEPDARDNYCEICGENKVISAMELLQDIG